MKKRRLGIIGKFLFFLNSVAGFLLLSAYILPYLPPRSFPYLSVLSLGMPVLLAVNLLFLFYWIIRLRRQFLLSLIILIVGFNHLLSLYKFKNQKSDSSEEGIRMMSYNVRQFNRYDWIKDKTIPEKIKNFIKEESPDVILFQEYVTDEVKFEDYPYSYIKLVEGKFGQSIYSKFPIIHSGSLDFKHTANNVIFSDLVIDKDTVRVFNMHLQSHRIDKDIRTLDAESGKKLTKKMGVSFRTQQQQVQQLLKSLAESPYPNIIGGDMNNTAFSYTYRKLTENHTDAFKVAGSGLGSTFIMDFIPLRIDYFLIYPQFKIMEFKTYKTKFSDHEPVLVGISLEK